LRTQLIILLSCLLVTYYSFAQDQTKIDSLQNLLKTKLKDTTRIKTLNALGWELKYVNPDTSIYYSERALALAQKAGWEKGIANSIRNAGVFNHIQGNYPLALDYYNKALGIWKGLENKKKQAGVLNNIGSVYKDQGDYESAIDYYNLSLRIAEEIGDKKGITAYLNNLGIVYKVLGDYESAIDHYTRSLRIGEEIGEKRAIANALNNIGLICSDQGDYESAIDHYTRSLKIKEEIGDKKGIAGSLNNIGNIYHDQGDYELAIAYYIRCLKIDEEMGYKKGIAISLNNIGNIYYEQGNYESAMDNHVRSLKIKQEINDKRGVSISLYNMGQVFRGKAKRKQSPGKNVRDSLLNKAISYYTSSLKIKEEIGDKYGIASSLSAIGLVYKDQKQFGKAKEYGERALAIAKEVSAVVWIKDASKLLYEVYKKTGQLARALEMHELYIIMRDSMANEESKKGVIRTEFQYKYEKKVLADSLEFAKQQEVSELEHQAQIKQEQVQRYGLYGGMAFLLLLGGVAFRSYRLKKRDNILIAAQKEEVEQQKEIVDGKNKEITDSIVYAKRIQEAILPPAKLVNRSLMDSFVLYKPKAIVSGDFYWMETIEGRVLFAAVDCTGHGVPGAMVSVVCHNAMNRAVREFRLYQPAAILDKARELVIETFEQSEHEVKDGMDIALCCLDRENKALEFAGANNPLWMIRKGELTETKGDKQPIGKYAEGKQFTNHRVELQDGDALYVFSDGYADQFGGPQGKKYKYKPFRELLLSIQDEPMEEQRTIIDQAFETWKGDLEQIDDVCVIGVRI